MNTTWKPLTADAFPKTAKEIHSTYVNGGTTVYKRTVYRSNDVYIIAIDSEHMPKTCDAVWTPKMGLDDGKYIIRTFYAQRTVYTDSKTGKSKDVEKAFYNQEGMIISIDDKDMKYCKYHRLETESLLG